MTAEQRREAFPGDYDLGNRRSLLPQLCSTDTLAEELTRELWHESKFHKDRTLDSSSFKKIKEGIAELTGRKMGRHYAHNKATALKVIKLLYRLNRDRWSSTVETGKKSNTTQLIELLRWPEVDRKFSLSLRDAYPYKKDGPPVKSPYKTSEEQSYLLADLKAYLSVELDEEAHSQIGGLPILLHWNLNNIERNVEKALVDRGITDYRDTAKAYSYVAGQLSRLTFEQPQADIALDEDLFQYLTTLEFAHFVAGYPALLDKAKPDCILLPVAPVIEMLTKDITECDTVGILDPFIASSQFSLFVQDSKNVLPYLIDKAFRKGVPKKISWSELNKLIPPALHLLQTYALFRKQLLLNGNVDAPVFSTLDCVAAICCVWYEKAQLGAERTQHKAFWQGQQAQGGSILPR